MWPYEIFKVYRFFCLKPKTYLNFKFKTELTPKDMERARFAFDIYDFEGKARMDLFYLGDCLRGLNLNPTLKMIEKLGGTKKKGDKFLKLEEVNFSLNYINPYLINTFYFSFIPSTRRSRTQRTLAHLRTSLSA